MYRGWNMLLALIFATLCGHSLGWQWPFQHFKVTAASNGSDLETTVIDDGIKRIAIIGMLCMNSLESAYCGVELLPVLSLCLLSNILERDEIV